MIQLYRYWHGVPNDKTTSLDSVWHASPQVTARAASISYLETNAEAGIGRKMPPIESPQSIRPPSSHFYIMSILGVASNTGREHLYNRVKLPRTDPVEPF